MGRVVQQRFRDVETFMIRSASLPLRHYFYYFNENLEQEDDSFIKEWCTHSAYRESILVSSKSLYETMELFVKGKEIKKKEQFLNSIHKYLIRMSTRPTPFGLFAGVGFGRFTEDATTIEKSPIHTKKARPDLDWLMKLVRKVETDYTVMLRYTNNNCIFIKGDRVVLPHSTLKETDVKSVQEVNIRATNAYQIVCNTASQSVTYSELIQAVRSHYPEVDEQVFHKFLSELIEKEYLISHVRPPLTVIDQMDYVIKQLEECLGEELIVLKLKEIQLKNEEYNRTALGDGEALYLELYRSMTELIESNSPMQVDLSLQGNPSYLNNRILQDVNQLIERLLSLLLPAGEAGTPLKNYRQDFIEKYGQNREVPLLEMIDEDIGIGSPATYTNPPSFRKEQQGSASNRFFTEKVQAYFWNKCVDSLTHGKSCIEIHDDELEELELQECPYDELPESFEINLLFKEEDGSESTQYYIGPNVGSTKAGKSFGRFAHVMNNPEKFFNTLHELNQELLNPDEYISCEISYLPNTLRNANVTRNIHGNEYEMALFTNNSRDSHHSLTLDDILIGDDGTSLYAKSKRLDKKVVFTFHNMLNPQIAPNAVRFLYDLSLEGERKWYNFPWEVIFKELPYIPMIKYRNFVLAPEKWVIHPLSMNLDKSKGFEGFEQSFATYRSASNLPQFVYITSGDNRIIMNLNDRKCLKILHHELVNNGNTMLLTSCEDFFDKAMDGPMDQHVHELIIPMVKMTTDKTESPSILIPEIRFNGISSTSSERIKLPFDDWVYFKLYGTFSREEELIGLQMAAFCHDLYEQNLIKGHYFIRYADPKPHIRLRLRGDQQQLLEAYPEIQAWLRSLIDKGMISHFVMDCYDREIERYGGITFIDAAEQVFCQDSVVTEKLIQAIKQKQIDWSNEIIGVIGIIRYMEQWGWDYQMQLDFLSSQVKQGDYREEFKKNRSQLMKMCNLMDEWEKLKTDPQGLLLLTILNEKSMAVRQYSELINTKRSQLSTHPWTIVDSLLHMHCNRLFGIDRELEKKLRALACHTLYALKHQYKHMLRV